MLSESQIQRYARHILLPEVGGRGQERLLAASVGLEVGPGRAAAVAALAYLAAAGVGTLVLGGPVDQAPGADELASGILYGAADGARSRLAALSGRIALLNPDVVVVAGDRSDAELWLDGLDGATDVADALVRGGQVAAHAVATLAGGR
jgi:molybdopterin-synthase adenylyltransferase